MADTQTALHTTNQSVAASSIRTPDRDAEIEIDLGELFLRLLDKWYIIVASAAERDMDLLFCDAAV